MEFDPKEILGGVEKAKKKRGFAVMDPKRVREIASMGGIQAHRSGHAHEFTPEEAKAAGKKRAAQMWAKRKAEAKTDE